MVCPGVAVSESAVKSEALRKLAISPTTCSNPDHHAICTSLSARNTAHPPRMPPKGKKGQEKGKSGEEERDEPLQAVVSCAMRPYRTQY